MTITTDLQHSKQIEQTEKKVLDFCRQNRLLEKGDRVIVACSGGADSVALLLFLVRCAETLGITVSATHVNHGIRGGAAQKDAEFVAELCRKNDVPFQLYDAVQSGVAVPQPSSEEWARQLRYGWFDALAAADAGVRIATAHTLTDQTETLLFRIARGTGLHGAAGIPVKRGVYRRPMLCLTREETVAYCGALGQCYVQDETNAQDAYARNRLRHYALPALCSTNVAAQNNVGLFCARMRELDTWLNSLARELLDKACTGNDKWNVSVLAGAQAPILQETARLLLSADTDADEKKIALLCHIIREGQGALQATQGVNFCIQNGFLERREQNEQQHEKKTEMTPLPQSLKIGDIAFSSQWKLTVEKLKYEVFLKNQAIYKKDLNCGANYGKITKNTVLRTRRPQDRYRPAGRGVGKTLKKFFNEQKVPRNLRDTMPLLADGNDVLWLATFGFADGLQPDENTDFVLCIRTEYLEDDGNA